MITRAVTTRVQQTNPALLCPTSSAKHTGGGCDSTPGRETSG
eukprot:CAMPEP_0204378212 /NCGR_PEP_ID=MMETSP0469-20131031/51590_1 /ASSEMBLY_ACC=CAM_ASM_000384 /TAXON_ID=2969 /ORGANISM="Oxyrrhis marina" /LENGTH=41 /DNA_ID= /DNA_START= /DNA_END= /DNA_ORIENTATION=